MPNNKLSELPTTIANIQSLYRIILNNNLRLRSIQLPNGSPNHSRLDIINCSIERIPHNLSHLSDLKLSNNNLTDLIGIGTLGNKTDGSKIFLS